MSDSAVCKCLQLQSMSYQFVFSWVVLMDGFKSWWLLVTVLSTSASTRLAAACGTACAIPGATCLPDCLHPSLPYLVILSFQMPIFFGFSRHVITHRDEKGMNKYFWKQSTPGLPSWCLHPPLTLCLPDTCPVPPTLIFLSDGFSEDPPHLVNCCTCYYMSYLSLLPTPGPVT